MKRLPIATLCAFLLMATSMSLPSAIEAKKLRWSNILESKSGIVIDIDGYKFQHRGTGWNAEYSRQMFSATTYNFDPPLYVLLLTDVLAEGYYWSNTKKSLESYIRSSFRFRNSFLSFVSRWGSSKDGSYDSDQGFAAAKFTLSHPTLNTCYVIRYAPHFGTTYRESFNPYISLQLCSKGDLNLELSDAKNIFSIDERNKTVGLNLSYQNLAQKIAALKNPTPSTSSGSVVAADAETYFYKFGNRHSCSTTYIPGNTSKQVCEMALNSSKTDWQKGVYPFELPCYIAEAKKRFPNSPLKECQRLVDASVPEKSEITSDGNGNIADRLKALKKLEDAGLISKEEAAAKRKDILKNL